MITSEKIPASKKKVLHAPQVKPFRGSQGLRALDQTGGAEKKKLHSLLSILFKRKTKQIKNFGVEP